MLSILEDSVDEISKIICLQNNKKNSKNSIKIVQSLYSETLKYLRNLYENTKIPTVPSSYKLPETNNVPLCYTDFVPRVGPGISTLVTKNSNWSLDLSPLDKKAVEKAASLNRGYIDRKMIHISQGNQSSIFLNIIVKHGGPIWLCEAPKGFLRYPDYMTDLDNGAEVYIQYNYSTEEDISSSEIDLSLMEKLELELLEIQCYRTKQFIKSGRHLLSLKQNSTRQINLAYVLTW